VEVILQCLHFVGMAAVFWGALGSSPLVEPSIEHVEGRLALVQDGLRLIYTQAHYRVNEGSTGYPQSIWISALISSNRMQCQHHHNQRSDSYDSALGQVGKESFRKVYNTGPPSSGVEPNDLILRYLCTTLFVKGTDRLSSTFNNNPY